MSEIWKRIIAWFAANVPADHYSFAEGASAGEIEQAESEMKLRFPDDLRESYLLHNGMEGEDAFFERYQLLAIDGIIQVWKMARDALECLEFQSLPNVIPIYPDIPVKNNFWNLNWIPIMYAEGERILIDLDPAPGGKIGQVIGGPEDNRLLAGSFREFVAQYADDLEAGKYIFDEGWSISNIKE